MASGYNIGQHSSRTQVKADIHIKQRLMNTMASPECQQVEKEPLKSDDLPGEGEGFWFTIYTTKARRDYLPTATYIYIHNRCTRSIREVSIRHTNKN